jgi:hypothetical protein
MNAVCVAGMHRSGTSMITRMLNLCGLFLGNESDLLPPAPDNPEGFWEHARFVQINDEILSTLGGSWDIPPEMKPNWEDSLGLAILREQAQELIQQFSQHDFWGWKDPRNSLTLPFWQRLIPDLKVVVCIRNPLEVAQSLSHRNQFSEIFSLKLWQIYNQRLISSSEVEHRLITHYITPFFNPVQELSRILEGLDINVDAGAIQNACHTTLSSLRHSSATFRSLVKEGVPLDSINLYTEMCLQAGEFFWDIIKSDIKSSSSDGLDLIIEQDLISKLKNKDPLLQLIIQWETDKQRQIERLTIRERELIAEEQALTAQVQTLTAQEQALTAQEQALTAQVQTLTAQVQTLTEQMAEREQTVRSLGVQLSEIFSSRAWKLILFIRQIRMKFLPPGSRREKLVHWLYQSLPVWHRKG